MANGLLQSMMVVVVRKYVGLSFVVCLISGFLNSTFGNKAIIVTVYITINEGESPYMAAKRVAANIHTMLHGHVKQTHDGWIANTVSGDVIKMVAYAKEDKVVG